MSVLLKAVVTARTGAVFNRPAAPSPSLRTPETSRVPNAPVPRSHTERMEPPRAVRKSLQIIRHHPELPDLMTLKLYRYVSTFHDSTLSTKFERCHWPVAGKNLGFYRAAWNATRSYDEISVRPSVPLSVCLSVCLSNACIVTKRKKAMFRFLYHMKDHLS